MDRKNTIVELALKIRSDVFWYMYDNVFLIGFYDHSNRFTHAMDIERLIDCLIAAGFQAHIEWDHNHMMHILVRFTDGL